MGQEIKSPALGVAPWQPGGMRAAGSGSIAKIADSPHAVQGRGGSQLELALFYARAGFKCFQ